ncbi:hypothetical protein THRCLA_21107 [Thraustotheca clavata]|uniref:Uncharacterized protein n=1 Tax=Thraustotheca clavata TaxID=74557 RepID=A0A1W0A056_9STRA|nr:hypothetical protein THRCLA_21107 [Thraustotheca clavata]
MTTIRIENTDKMVFAAVQQQLPKDALNFTISQVNVTISYNRSYNAWSPPQSSCWGSCVMCPIFELFEVPVEWVHPLRRCIFENITMWCPADSEKYLTMLYGPTYMISH